MEPESSGGGRAARAPKDAAADAVAPTPTGLRVASHGTVRALGPAESPLFRKRPKDAALLTLKGRARALKAGGAVRKGRHRASPKRGCCDIVPVYSMSHLRCHTYKSSHPPSKSLEISESTSSSPSAIIRRRVARSLAQCRLAQLRR